MPRSKKIKHTNEEGKPICGAKVKSRGRAGSGKLCQKPPMRNGKCKLHGGASTGPKNSIAYYQKQVYEAPGGTRLKDALEIENFLDLTGEIGFVRKLITQMQEDPLRVYCTTCKQWVRAEVKCSNEDSANAALEAAGKRTQAHFVHARDNDYSKVILATKQLSEITKNHKEIQKGKEIIVRVEILNMVVMKIVEAYEQADYIDDRTERRRKFIEGVDKLLIESITSEALERAAPQSTKN